MKVYWDTINKRWHRPQGNLFPTGSRVYKGFQGSGKTLSMVDYAFRVRSNFPKCKLFSNIKLFGIRYYHFSNADELALALNVRNGQDGCIVLIDEAHLFFNKKNGISLDVLTAISQQRKDRVRLIFSSQIWEELDISLRKQVKEIVSCRCFLGKWQVNTISNGETLRYNKLEGQYEAQKIRTEIFKHNDEMYKRYDTFQKIMTNEEYNRQTLNLVYNENVVSK